MPTDSVRLLVLGAHPDDAEYHAGGLISIYSKLGHTIKLVSVSDGGAGHHRFGSEELVQIRRKEAAAAGRVVDAEYVTWDNPDGALQPTLNLRQQIIREIRTFKPDLVLTHRTNDYHPDHRAVGQAVQDASYMVTVPLVCPDVPILDKDPIVAYMVDLFTKPYPHQGDFVLDVTAELDTIVEMMACHHSQFLDFLPFNAGLSDQVPADGDAQKPWLRDWFKQLAAPRAEHFGRQLIQTYGEEQASNAEVIEAYEISEYAGTLEESLAAKLFPKHARH